MRNVASLSGVLCALMLTVLAGGALSQGIDKQEFEQIEPVAHSLLSSEIGGPGRNWDPVAIANGFSFGHIEAAVIGVAT